MTPDEARAELLIVVGKLLGQHIDTPASKRLVIRDLLRVIETDRPEEGA